MILSRLNKSSAILVGFGLFIYYATPPVTIMTIDKFLIRSADLISFALVCICAPAIFKFLNRAKVVLFLSLFLIFSLLWGWQYNGSLQALYLLRLVQYFLLGIVIYYFAKSDYFNRWVVVFLMFQSIWSALQYMKILQVFDTARGNYFHNTFSGTFGNTAELSYFIFFLMVLFRSRSPMTPLITGSFLSLNGVIAPALTTASLSLRRFFKLCPPLLLTALIFSVIASGVFFLTTPGVISEASREHAHLRGFVLLKGAGLLSQDFYFDLDILRSIEMRINKFLGLFFGWKSDIFVVLFGCGYGCGYGAVDSGLYRFVLEFGLFGVLFFFLLARKLHREYLVAIILGSIFFDSFWSSATASLIWAIIFHAADERRFQQLEKISRTKSQQLQETAKD